MGGTRDPDVKWNNPDWERQIFHVLFYAQSLVLKKDEWNTKTGFVWEWVPAEGGSVAREAVGG
jgi:hypothetical protein